MRSAENEMIDTGADAAIFNDYFFNLEGYSTDILQYMLQIAYSTNIQDPIVSEIKQILTNRGVLK